MNGVPRPGDLIDIPTVPNLRDLGGYATADGGRVRRGQLYRSTDLTHLEGEDVDRFARLGIRLVVDLRTEAERTAEPDVVLEGTEVLVCDVLRDAQGAAPAQVVQALTDPALAEQLLGGGKAFELFEDGYRQVVSLPSALEGYGRFFTTIGDGTRRPALFHCTTGKDRTGWAAASVLLLLGVSEQDVLFDYLLTNRDLLPALAPLFDQFRAKGGDPELLQLILGVQEGYLHAAMQEMQETFGGIEGYFSEGLGIDLAGQQRLRDALTERDAS